MKKEKPTYRVYACRVLRAEPGCLFNEVFQITTLENFEAGDFHDQGYQLFTPRPRDRHIKFGKNIHVITDETEAAILEGKVNASYGKFTESLITPGSLVTFRFHDSSQLHRPDLKFRVYVVLSSIEGITASQLNQYDCIFKQRAATADEVIRRIDAEYAKLIEITKDKQQESLRQEAMQWGLVYRKSLWHGILS